MFAPLVIDLDGRVNFNVHGNIRGAEENMFQIKAGAVEVSLERICTTDAAEWKNLFVGGPATPTCGPIRSGRTTDAVAAAYFRPVWPPSAFLRGR